MGGGKIRGGGEKEGKGEKSLSSRKSTRMREKKSHYIPVHLSPPLIFYIILNKIGFPGSQREAGKGSE